MKGLKQVRENIKESKKPSGPVHVEVVSVGVVGGSSLAYPVAKKIAEIETYGYQLAFVTTAYVEQHLSLNSLVHTLVFKMIMPPRPEGG